MWTDYLVYGTSPDTSRGHKFESHQNTTTLGCLEVAKNNQEALHYINESLGEHSFLSRRNNLSG